MRFKLKKMLMNHFCMTRQQFKTSEHSLLKMEAVVFFGSARVRGGQVRVYVYLGLNELWTL